MEILILILIGIVLILMNVKAIKKDDKKNFNDYMKENDNKDRFLKEMASLRVELGETVFSLQDEIETLKERVNLLESLNRNKKDSYEKEESHINTNLNQYEDLKNEEDIVEVDSPSEEIIDVSNDVLPLAEKMEQLEENLKEQLDEKSNEVIQINNNVRVQEIKELIEDGFELDEISEKLGMSKGEVLLIRDLYIK